MSEKIAVVPVTLFEECGYFEGFNADIDAYVRLLKPALVRFKPREAMEEDPTWKQLIPYVILTKTLGDHEVYFSYQRGKGQGEERLHGKHSIGVGGHVNDEDCGTHGDPFMAGLWREIFEEVMLTPVMDPLTSAKQEIVVPQYKLKRVGFVNDDKDDVGKVHLGVVCKLYVDKFTVQPAETDMDNVRWWDLETLRKGRESYEGWSQICIDALDQVT
jgi:predicted NUDIX family phosphoesterase